MFADGLGFAGETGFVAFGVAGGDAEIDGDLLAWRDTDEHACGDVGDGDFAEGAVGEDLAGGFGDIAEERGEGGFGAEVGVVFEGGGAGEEDEEESGFLPVAEESGGCGGREHEEVDVERAAFEACEGVFDEVDAAGGAGGEEAGGGDGGVGGGGGDPAGDEEEEAECGAPCGGFPRGCGRESVDGVGGGS